MLKKKKIIDEIEMLTSYIDDEWNKIIKNE